ncbi:unnamed protein product [Chilo suppressalis]|uniref:Gag-like protein n=1 Tax=Chilo suppressalis TaxID=168631 RepID=A0ABN8B9C6_CHISP|nr:unnamed protein product [Chilo suppressalis]
MPTLRSPTRRRSVDDEGAAVSSDADRATLETAVAVAPEGDQRMELEQSPSVSILTELTQSQPPPVPAGYENQFQEYAAGIVDHVKKIIGQLDHKKSGSTSVTKSQKMEALSHCQSIISLCAGLTKEASSRSAPLSPPPPTSPPSHQAGNADSLAMAELALIKKDIREIKDKLSSGGAPTRTTYAHMASTSGKGIPPAAPTPVNTIKTARPALILTCDATNNTTPREAATKVLRKVINCNETGYTVARLTQLSKGKTKVEFDKPEHREDALRRFKQASPSLGARAEPEKRISAMVILKGISKEVKKEELMEHIIRQNPELGGCGAEEISIKFIRNNRNTALYNAVLTTSPRAWTVLTRMGRVRVEFQRVHVENFSPFLQCRRCQQFGHTQTRCERPELCSHCSRGDHTAQACPTAAAPPTCGNCVSFNARNPYPCPKCIYR